jgi:hypothetical protein
MSAGLTEKNTRKPLRNRPASHSQNKQAPRYDQHDRRWLGSVSSGRLGIEFQGEKIIRVRVEGRGAVEGVLAEVEVVESGPTSRMLSKNNG